MTGADDPRAHLRAFLRRPWMLWAPVAIWCAAIFTLSSFSKLPAPPSGITDKHEHFFFYGILGALFLRAFAGARWAGVTWLAALVAVLCTMAYGATDEFHQSFVPGRDCSLGDLAADSLGAAAAAALILACAIIRRSRARATDRVPADDD